MISSTASIVESFNNEMAKLRKDIHTWGLSEKGVTNAILAMSVLEGAMVADLAKAARSSSSDLSKATANMNRAIAEKLELLRSLKLSNDHAFQRARDGEHFADWALNGNLEGQSLQELSSSLRSTPN